MLSSEMVVALWPWCLPAGLALPDPAPDVVDLTGTLSVLALIGTLILPRPGLGRTMDRFIALAETSALDLSLGRLVEGHADADAILAEAGRRPPPAAPVGRGRVSRRDGTRRTGRWRRPLCHDAAQARRMADLPVYIRQHHAERDAAELGRFLLSGDAEA